MTKFSVRKPFTVIVCVIAVIVFGIISYTQMVPDLLPNMDYPYVIILTTYPGATPGEVEVQVTKPLEQAMATLNNIKTISSSSGENYSMISLEFEQETSMDAAVVDILQKTQQISGSWDENVGTPNIIRINPSMLPVMVTAVSSDTLDRYELCTLAQKTLIPELEGTTGLASISAGGLVERQLLVTLNQSKLDAANEKIADGINKSLEEAKTKLDDAQRELDNATDKVTDGKDQLISAPRTMVEEVGGYIPTLDDLRAKAEALAADLSAMEAEKASLIAEKLSYETRKAKASATLELRNMELEYIQAKRDVLSPALMQEDDSMSVTEAGVDIGDLLRYGLTCRTVGEARALDAALQSDEAVAEMNVRAAQLSYDEISSFVDKAIANIDERIDEIDEWLAELLDQITINQKDIEKLSNGIKDMSGQLFDGIGQMTDAAITLAAAQANLTTAQETLDKAKDSFDEQSEAAIKASDVRNILNLETLCTILGAQNFDMPAGYVSSDGSSVLVTVGDGIDTRDLLNNTVLFDMGLDSVEPIRLCDVADLTVTDNTGDIYATLNGDDGLLLMFFKQSNYATASVSNNLMDSFAELSEKYPSVKFTPLMDQGDYIYLIRDSILSSILWGVVFSVIILFLFLRDWRPTLLTLFSIPVSLLFAMMLMYFTGVSLNVMSLSGLAISVGMLVDNSIVVIENTYRLRSLGESPMKAAVSGAAQVGGAIAASTLTTVCVFIPVVFVTGIVRELFTDMILTLCYALIASLIIALTLVPALAGKLLTKDLKAYGEDGKAMTLYGRTVRWGVRHKAVVLCSATALLVVSAVLVLNKGFTFMPSMQMEQMSVTLTMPEGSSFDDTVEQANEASARMLSVDGVETVGGSISGSTGGSAVGISSGASDKGVVTFYVLLEKGSSMKANQVAKQINELCSDMPCEVHADANSIMSSMTQALSGSGIKIRLFSNDMDKLQEGSEIVSAELLKVEGVTSAGTDEEDLTPEVHFTVDKAKAAKNNLTVAQVYMEVAKALTNSAELMEMEDDDKTYTVIVRTGEDDDITPQFIENFTFKVKDKKGEEQTVALRDIASVSDSTALSTIHRLEQRRYLDVNAEVSEDYNITKVTDAAEEALKNVKLPKDVEIRFSGEREAIMDALEKLLLLMLAGILLVYLVMVAQFQNLKAPFIVMFTVPLAFTGGFLAMLIFDMEVNTLSMLGLIMLVGIIVNNGIVLVDYINQLREAGSNREDAIVEAAVTRLRPILMTTITTVLGLAVMALGNNEGTSIVRPLAITCIGGLVYATAMTLYVIPVMYDILSKKELRHIDEEDLKISDK